MKKGEKVFTEFSKEQMADLVLFRGLELPELAEKMGISKTMIYKYRVGDSRPTEDKVKRMAEILQVDSKYLAENKENERQIGDANSIKHMIQSLIENSSPAKLSDNKTMIELVLKDLLNEAMEAVEAAGEADSRSQLATDICVRARFRQSDLERAKNPEYIRSIREEISGLVETCAPEFLEQKYELIKWFLDHSEENWKILWKFAAPQLNPLGQAIVYEQLEAMTENPIFSGDGSGQQLKANVRYVVQEEDENEIILFVDFSPWFQNLFRLEEICGLPCEISAYTDDLEMIESEADLESFMIDQITEYFDQELADSFGADLYAEFFDLLDEAQWSFTELEYVNGDQDPFSPENIGKTKKCLDELFLAMAWHSEGAEIRRILTDLDFAHRMFEKYHIEPPIGW